MYRALNRRRALDFMSGAWRRRRSERPETITYGGKITLEPPDIDDAYSGSPGAIWLEDAEGNRAELLDYLYEKIDPPREDGYLPPVAISGRIILEIHPDPDARFLLG